MMKRHWLKVVRVALPGAFVAAMAASASAQIVQVTRSDARHAVGFNLGYFAVKGEDSRVDDDVLVANLSSSDPLLFEIDDFNGFTLGGEWLYGVSEYIETGVGIGYYQRTVTSIYADKVNANGSEIVQDLKLRIAPITATVRFLPIGRSGPVEPYIGGGIGFFLWRYSETGEFVDSSDDTIFRDTYKADGAAVGPVILGGIRFPAGDAVTVGAELKWQKAEGDTNSVESRLLGNKIDLGGTSFNFTMHFRF
ncbi:MAG TPA: outer membrane beta-barrel protein [Vicinamibacterales bacterium]|nr:outer membrane beta-barrel protein [Vicinamibacterales bacterium]